MPLRSQFRRRMRMAANMMLMSIFGKRRVINFPQPRQMRQQMGRELMKGRQATDQALRNFQRRQAPAAFPLVPRLRQALTKILRAPRAFNRQRPEFPQHRIGDQRRQSLRRPPAEAGKQVEILNRRGLETESRPTACRTARPPFAALAAVPPGTRSDEVLIVSLSITRLIATASCCRAN